MTSSTTKKMSITKDGPRAAAEEIQVCRSEDVAFQQGLSTCENPEGGVGRVGDALQLGSGRY